jgi:hypothetical protein
VPGHIIFSPVSGVLAPSQNVFVTISVPTNACTRGLFWHPDRSPHRAGQTESILPRVRKGREKTALAALASVCLWDRSGAAGPLFGVSGLDPGSRSSHPLVCPGGHSLGSFGGEAAGRTRTGATTGE